MDDFEFFKMLFPGMYNKRLRLPNDFVLELGDCRELRLQLAGAGMPLRDVEVSTDEKDGAVYLDGGWEEFAHAHKLGDAYLLVFRYDRGAATLVVTVFDPSTWPKQYVHAGTAATSSTPAHVIKWTVKRGAKSVTCYRDPKNGRWCSPLGVKRGDKSSGPAKGQEEVRRPYKRSQQLKLEKLVKEEEE